MIKNQPKRSLSDRITDVLSAIPTQFNPDDDHTDDTSAKLTDFDEFNNENDDDEELLSKFRKQNVDLLADVDKKYAGKKGSRKSLQVDSSDEFSEDNEDNDDKKELDENDSTDENEDKDNLEQDFSGSENDVTPEESENEGSTAMSEVNESGFQHMRDTNISQQVKKGLCVRNQMNMWENLLEVRIQLQKCLVAANKMPQESYHKKLARECDPEQDFKKKVHETRNNLGNVLDKLLILQNLVIKKYPETKNLEKKEKEAEQNKDESDEEIPSDTEDELENNESDSEEEIKAQNPKRRKLSIDYERDISNLHERYKTYRNETIEKWNTKTRLSVTKNSGQTHSVVNHIAHILTDKDKLRRRTQLKRSDFKIIGQAEAENTNSSEDNGDIRQVEEYNTEIFDDSDFYHQLLRELIEVKSVDITDPVQLGRQWIQLQNLRSKMKRKIDTRATKGRKIRYAVHSKLVNFMAPLDNQSWTEEAKNELYSSVFGKSQPKITQLS